MYLSQIFVENFRIFGAKGSELAPPDISRIRRNK